MLLPRDISPAVSVRDIWKVGLVQCLVPEFNPQNHSLPEQSDRGLRSRTQPRSATLFSCLTQYQDPISFLSSTQESCKSSLVAWSWASPSTPSRDTPRMNDTQTPTEAIAFTSSEKNASTQNDDNGPLLFSPDLISPEVISSLPEGYTMRPLRRSDYYGGKKRLPFPHRHCKLTTVCHT